MPPMYYFLSLAEKCYSFMKTEKINIYVIQRVKNLSN